MSYPKGSGGRGTVEGGQEALIDLKLLASCPILVGTFYSSYSETAKLLSGAYYMSVSSQDSSGVVDYVLLNCSALALLIMYC